MFPTLNAQQLSGRRSKKLLAEDMFVIGYSLCNKLEDQRLRKILKQCGAKQDDSANVSIGPNDEGDTQTLTILCAELKTTVNVLQTLVKTLVSRIDTLESEATEMKIQLKRFSEPKETKKSDQIEIIFEAEVHHDMQGVPQKPEKKNDISEDLTEADTIVRLDDDDSGEYRHSTEERRNILQGKRSQYKVKASNQDDMTTENRFAALDKNSDEKVLKFKLHFQLTKITSLLLICSMLGD